MKKKILALSLTFVLSCSLVTGCGSNNTPAESEAPATVETPAEEEAPATEEATESEAPAEEVSETDVVKEAAMAYFAEFPEDKHMITVPDLFAKMDAGEDMLLIDIRSAEDYANGHLKGAVNVPYGTVGESLDIIPDDVPIYVNCYSGQTSSQTTALLNVAGKYATNIQGGFNRGISTAENYENYIETTENTLSGDEYPVDEAIKAAIVDYYAKATSDTFASFNFPVDSLAELVEAESDAYTILSIRQAEDYAAGHIAGAMNIPFGKGMQESFSTIPTDKPVVVYCYSGQTASQTIAILRMLGFEAFNLAGGMGSAETESGWLGAGQPVVTD